MRGPCRPIWLKSMRNPGAQVFSYGISPKSNVLQGGDLTLETESSGQGEDALITTHSGRSRRSSFMEPTTVAALWGGRITTVEKQYRPPRASSRIRIAVRALSSDVVYFRA